MANVTTNAFLDAIEAALEADSTLRTGGSPLIPSDDSIEQWHKTADWFDAIQKLRVRTPALMIAWADDEWTNPGQIHDLKNVFHIYVLIQNVAGIQARISAFLPIKFAVYTALVDTQLLGGDNILARRAGYLAEVPDKDGNPIEASSWVVEFEATFAWQ